MKNERYSRNILLHEIGEDGQRKLGLSRVLIVGCGGTGGDCAEMLVRAGVGSLTIMDRDLVDVTNLQRQTLFTGDDVGVEKAIAARRMLERINPEVKITAIVDELTGENGEGLIDSVDLVMDCTDNMDARFVINDACVKLGKSWVYMGAISTYGMVAPFVPGNPCFRCLFPAVPKGLPTCDSAGVLNTMPGIMGHMGATEGIRILVGAKSEPILISYDGWAQSFERMTLKKREGCECCEMRDFGFLSEKREDKITELCGGVFQITPSREGAINLEELAKKLDRIGEVRHSESALVFKGDGIELTVFHNGRTLVSGAGEITEAKAIYKKHIEG